MCTCLYSHIFKLFNIAAVIQSYFSQCIIMLGFRYNDYFSERVLRLPNRATPSIGDVKNRVPARNGIFTAWDRGQVRCPLPMRIDS